MTEESRLINVQKPNRRRGEGWDDMGSKTREGWKAYLEEFGFILNADDKAAINKALKSDRENN